jgi:hypothetical protein
LVGRNSRAIVLKRPAGLTAIRNIPYRDGRGVAQGIIDEVIKNPSERGGITQHMACRRKVEADAVLI